MSSIDTEDSWQEPTSIRMHTLCHVISEGGSVSGSDTGEQTGVKNTASQRNVSDVCEDVVSVCQVVIAEVNQYQLLALSDLKSSPTIVHPSLAKQFCARQHSTSCSLPPLHSASCSDMQLICNRVGIHSCYTSRLLLLRTVCDKTLTPHYGLHPSACRLPAGQCRRWRAFSELCALTTIDHIHH